MKPNSVFEILFIHYIAHWFARNPEAHRDRTTGGKDGSLGFAVNRMFN